MAGIYTPGRSPIIPACMLLALTACDGTEGPRPVDGPLTVTGEHGTLKVGTDPFSLTLLGTDGETVLESATDPEEDADAGLAYGTFAAIESFHYYNPAHTEADGSSDLRWIPDWHAAGAVTRAVEADGGWDLTVQIDDDVASELLVTVRPETEVGFRITFEVVDPGAVAFTRFGFDTSGDEHFHGLGERFDRTDASGGAYEMVMGIGDLDSNLNEVHVPVPFYVSSRGYGLFWEDLHPSYFDLGASEPGRVRVTWSTREPVTLHVITGEDPLDVASRYGRLTGPAVLPPIWAFAPFQWRNELDSRDQLLEDAQAIRDADIPGSCIWIDNPWQTAYNTFLFNPVQFPDAGSMLAELESLGFRSMVWSTPYLDSTDDRWVEGMEPDTGGLFEEARDAGYFVTSSSGSPQIFTWSGDKAGGRIDFTNPEAVTWWQDLVGRVTEMGVVGFKLDYGEMLVPTSFGDAATDFNFADGTTATTMHKRYSILYHRTYRDRTREDLGESFILGRSSTWGGQRDVEAIWPGDMDASFLEHREENADGNPAVGGLPAVIAACQNLAVSGFPAYGSDTGGYRDDDQDGELLARWAAHTAMTPIMQLGGGDHHNVWDETVYDPEVLSIYRSHARLHTRLLPLWYTLANLATDEGTPPIRPLGIVFPGDDPSHAAWDEYMVGDWLLVAPVRERGATSRQVHLPPGRWVHWFSGEAWQGPDDVVVDAPLGSLPLFMREGAVVPMIADDVDTFVPTTHDDLVTLDERDDLLFVRILPSGSSSFRLWPDEGGSITVDEVGGGVDVHLTAGSWFTRWVLEIDWDHRAGADGSPPGDVQLGGAPLAEEADPLLTASGGCDGCWSWIEGTGTLLVSSSAGALTVR